MPSSARERTREVDVSTLRRKWRKTRKAPKLPLGRTHPEIAAQWHPIKNKGLSPSDITYGSNVKVWWICEVHPSHEWKTSAHARCGPNGEQRSGCPYCSGNKACVTNSLASLCPQIAAEWHPVKNRPLTPEQVTVGSNRNVWWHCKIDKSHCWQTCVGWRTQDQTGCPFCSNKQVSKTNSLEALFPNLAADWHPTKNGKITASEMVAGSHQIVWWQCKHNHEWQTSLKSRVIDQTGCPFCTGRRPTQFNNLAARYPQIANEWHPVKNVELSPWSIVPGSHLRIWWRCSKNSKHEWQAKAVSRTRSGSGCPSCADSSKTRKNASRAYNLVKLFPKIAEQWHPKKNGDLKPSHVTPGSNKKIWWKCAEASDHIWCTMVCTRVRGKTGCPFCSGKKASKTNCLASKWPKIAAEWHPSRNGALTPNQIPSGTKRQVWWRCSKNERHIWQTPVHKRTGRGQGCPKCRLLA